MSGHQVWCPVTTLVCLCASGISSNPTIAQCDPVEIAKLLASDGSNGDFVGVSVSISGDTAILGAVGDDDRGVNSGSAYIFERVAGVWSQSAKLLASDGFDSDYFGWAVSVSGNTAMVGSYRDDDLGADSGSVYVFEKVAGVWNQTAKLTASDGAANDWFGYSVSINGDTAFIGARYDDDLGDASGSVYVFDRVAGVWSLTAKLTAADGAAGDNFGVTVSLSGGTAVIGAVGDDDLGDYSGSAYIFEKSGGVWSQAAKLLASDGLAGDWFGISVGLHNDTAVVGAYYDDAPAVDSGSSYVFERVAGLWTETGKLVANDGAANDYFGCAVSVSSSAVLVGAFNDADNGKSSGSAYVYTKTAGTWTQASKVLAPDGASGDWFGIAVALEGGDALIGARYDDDLGADSGSTYVFDLQCGPSLRSIGSCPGRIDFIVDAATPGGRVAYLYAQGKGAVQIPPGNPCVGTTLGLNGTVQLANTVFANANGTATLSANAPRAACGRIFVQALDLESCQTTNVVLVQ